MKLQVRLRPMDSREGNFKEVLSTVNASREGFLFITNSERYYPGMRLRIVYPYSAADDLTAAELDAEVLRTVHLGDKRTGVAVAVRKQFRATPAVNGQPAGERRLTPRFAASTMAVVSDATTGMQLQARCSDASLNGCYVDTLNPFCVGTNVILRLTHEATTIDIAARVTVCHMGMGMGLSFEGQGSEKESALAILIGAKPTAPPASGNVEPTHSPRVRDQVGAEGLVRLLKAKGICTEEELTAALLELIA
jgi:hypothetical protein